MPLKNTTVCDVSPLEFAFLKYPMFGFAGLQALVTMLTQKEEKMKKIIALIMALATVMSFAACSGKDQPELPSGDSSSEEDTGVFSNLPKANYGGRDFVIHGRTYTAYEFTMSEDTTNKVDQELYSRNQLVNDRFGVNITTVIDSYNWDSKDDYTSRLRTNQFAGTSEFDLVAGYAAVVSQLIGEGTFLNWNDQPYINTDNEWWVAQFNEEMTVNGKCYMITGDAALSLWKNMSCVFFNKLIANNFQIQEDLYDLVEAGEWNLEKLKEISKLVYSDKNANNERDAGDVYGLLLGRSTAIDNMMMAFDLPVTKKDGDGVPQLALRSPRFVNIASEVVSFANSSENNVFFIAEAYRGGDSESIKQRFMNAEGLFFMGLLEDSEQIRGADIGNDVGILPYPKYNENQVDYKSTARDEFSCFFLPTNASDPEMTALILEALAVSSKEYVIPEYYDVVLKIRNSVDVESSAMIDLIREKLTFNFGFVYGTSIEFIHGFLANLVRSNSASVDSSYQQNETKYKEALANVLKPYLGEE